METPIQQRLEAITEKVQRLHTLMLQIKSDNLRLTRENADLVRQLDTQNQPINDNIAEADQDHFEARLAMAKKVKREIEQALRDAERKLEALRF